MKTLLAIAIAAISISEIRAEAVVTNAADLARLVYHEKKLGGVFDLHCTVSVSKSTSEGSKVFAIDSSGGVILLDLPDCLHWIFRRTI